MIAKKKLSVVTSEVPGAPYPPDTAANGWHPELHINRITSSDTWTLAEDDERPWLLRIWMESWLSVPVGSMPSDRRLFARRIGCKAAFLDAHAEILLRGWELHADGLLYHQFISGQVLGMLGKRRKDAEKVAAWRERKKAKEMKGGDDDVTGNSGGCNGNAELRNGKLPKEQEQEQDITPKPPEGASFSLPPSVDPDAWSDFVQHRREIKKPLKGLAVTKNVNLLASMSRADQREAVDATIRNRWTGIFEPKRKAGETVSTGYRGARI